MTEKTSDTIRHNGVPAFDFKRLSEYGVLWLINRTVFHPRGYALSLIFEDGIEEPTGWSIIGDGSEPWKFDDSIDEDERFLQIEGLLNQASQFGRAPHIVKTEEDGGLT